MNPRIIRALGLAMFVLGFGSIFMRSQLDMDTILTAWMGDAQPWSGVVMGVIGAFLAVIGIRQMAADGE